MKPTIDQVCDILKEKFSGDILAQEQQYDFTVFTITRESLLPMFRFLYDDETLQFRYLTTACGVHYPDNEKPYAMMYQLHSLVNNLRLRFKIFTAKDNVEFDSLTPLFSAANWMERETYDFYGFTFKGHPNLIRILNVEDMDYFPMRKEYPVEDQTRYDKDDTMFGREPANFTKLT
jgi:NADH-quinone oxidoreductase subunit C